MGFRRVSVSNELLELILRTGHQSPATVVLDGLPDGARLHTVFPGERRTVELVFEAEAWGPGGGGADVLALKIARAPAECPECRGDIGSNLGDVGCDLCRVWNENRATRP